MLKQPKARIIVILEKNSTFKYMSKVVNSLIFSIKARYLFGKTRHTGPDCDKGAFSLAL